MPSGTDGAVVPSQPSTSHMMKTTKRGRPYLKDTFDLFATLIVSLKLTTHKQFFRTHTNSFSTDEAAQNLAALKFSQSNRGPDPREPSRVVTTTTTTTFSMTRDMAKAMSQHFMDARLIENAADPSSNLFKDRTVYVLTPKGLHVLERFISKNGMTSDHLQNVFATQPICIKLLHLERRAIDDEIIVTQSVITALFRRFAGRHPNYIDFERPKDPFALYHERSKGIALCDGNTKDINGRTNKELKYCFAAVTALEWLCDFTSVVGREEAAEMAAQFVRFGLIALVSDKRKNNDSAIIFTVRGSAPAGNSAVTQHGEFRCTAKAIYRITDEGRACAQWDELDGAETPQSSSLHLPQRLSASDAHYEAGEKTRESNSDRLRYILEEPQLRALFREFLRSNFSEENLSFWLDVKDFKRKFNITSSATALAPANRGGRHAPGQAAMERHHESLIHTAFVIYNKYLAPSSQHELNIDHGLRNELAGYLNEVMTSLTGREFHGHVDLTEAHFNATQLQTMIRLYERIQTHIFRLMATDSVPKFIKLPRFKAMRDWVGDTDPIDSDVLFLTAPSQPPGLGGGVEEGGAYMTISPQATEREQRRHDSPSSLS
ncbi:hypothetical protein PILCRDRAFT_68766 [Piloderma croceum F 1598]|uniref:RGS domain-containing protein n=1 Tax=Piloderma croceum (strain F 1598) TaxID=765440 RepID=A0A0C3G045_PILCF|nr:hypothetical protein PILCRDRAFT_68766 [Piloderma croceum F 1598]